MDDTFWWLPPVYSVEGEAIDELWNVITWVIGIIFVLVQGAIVYACIRYRRGRSQRAAYLTGNRTIEVIWTLIPTAILIWVMVISQDLWAELKLDRPSEDEIGAKVWIDAERFAWNVTYPGVDGEFGTDDDVRGALNKVVLPVNETILVQLTSRDVLHSFFVPYLRVKQDAVPGLTTELWFKVTRPTGPGPDGEFATWDDEVYDLVCAELCGGEHFAMVGRVHVLEPEPYRLWMERKLQEKEEEDDDYYDDGYDDDPEEDEDRP